MNRYTLNFNNLQLEEIYQKREIPALKNWTQKMAAVVCLIGMVTILFSLLAAVESPKPYISQLLLVFSALITIILLQFKKKYFNIIHTINCTIYMCTMIWTYADKDFYRDIQQDYLNGYIQGLATFVYITGTRFLPKLFLITLLFINMAFCRGQEYFLAQFMQVSPLWLIFIYKIYVEERNNRQLFLSQQQEHVYKYIIQNVMPNGLYLVKYDKTVERLELHSSNQKPKILSYVKNTDDMKHLLKNTILAGDDSKLQNLLQSNGVTWSDTLDGHLRRKIDQALEWGEKRFIKLKDRNVIRSKQGTSSNDSDNGQGSVFNNSHYNMENARSITKNTILNTEQDIQNTQVNHQNQQIQCKKKELQFMSDNKIAIPHILGKDHKISSPTYLQNQVLLPDGKGQQLSERKNAKNKMKYNQTQSTSQNNNYNSEFNNNRDNSSNILGQGLNKLGSNYAQKQQKVFTNPSQQIISVQEVATNLLANSSNLNAIQQQNIQSKRLHPNSYPQKSSLTQNNVAAAGGQTPIDKRVMMNETTQNTYTDLVEYFSAVYKKTDDTQYKLNLRLSTFYLNEIYGVISVEDESFKEKFQQKERAYNQLLEIYIKTIKEINNEVVINLYKIMHQNVMAKSNTQFKSRYCKENMFQMLKLKNKLDNYNHVIQIINNKYPKKIQINECCEFSLIDELKPFFDVCQQKAKAINVKLFIDYSASIVSNDLLFTNKSQLNHLIFNLVFNVIENTPSKGFIAIRVDSFDNNQQIKFKIFNTTTNIVDIPFFQSFHEPISITALINDIKMCDRPQIGLRLSHRILQKIGPSSKIEYQSSNCNMTESSNNLILNNVNNTNMYGMNGNNTTKEMNNSSSQAIQLNTLYQTFYIYRNMQSILGSNPQTNQNKSNTYNDIPKSQIGQSYLLKNTPYQLETKSNRNQFKNDAYLNSIPLDKSSNLQNNNNIINNINNIVTNGVDKPFQEQSTFQKQPQPVFQNRQFMNTSDICIEESNDSFKHWLKARQYEEYNKSVPKLLGHFNKKEVQSDYSLKLTSPRMQEGTQNS